MMSEKTKKELIFELFEESGNLEYLKREEELFMEQTKQNFPNVDEEKIKALIENQFVKVALSIFEKELNKEFNKKEMEELVVLYKNPLLKRLRNLVNIRATEVQSEVDKLLDQIEIVLFSLSLTDGESGEDDANGGGRVI